MAARTILITGGNGGLGRAIAAAFLEEDTANQVWLGVRSNRGRAEALADGSGGRCKLVDLDVTDPAAWSGALELIVADGGRLDVLVNNAGHHSDGLLATMSDETWQSVVAPNLDGAFYGCRAVVKTMMAQRGGRIVNISSLSALMAPLGQTNYAAAKAGMLGMTQSLAKEVARAGITVNAICPGYIETEALGKMDAEQRKVAAKAIPMRRFGKPQEVAAAVVFLACPEASYITGSVLKIDGGIF
jgi:3-oxoacyl-[acyl-carrier protein] reductase